MNKNIIIAGGIIGAAVIISAFAILNGSGEGNGNAEERNVVNTAVIDGVQYIDISAKGGYEPRKTEAKAGLPTIIRMKTSGTYDCSAAVAIPKLNFRKNLLPSGITEIEVPPQEPGSTLNGTCAMGMYNFSVNFN